MWGVVVELIDFAKKQFFPFFRLGGGTFQWFTISKKSARTPQKQ